MNLAYAVSIGNTYDAGTVPFSVVLSALGLSFCFLFDSLLCTHKLKTIHS